MLLLRGPQLWQSQPSKAWASCACARSTLPSPRPCLENTMPLLKRVCGIGGNDTLFRALVSLGAAKARLVSGAESSRTAERQGHRAASGFHPRWAGAMTQGSLPLASVPPIAMTCRSFGGQLALSWRYVACEVSVVSWCPLGIGVSAAALKHGRVCHSLTSVPLPMSTRHSPGEFQNHMLLPEVAGGERKAEHSKSEECPTGLLIRQCRRQRLVMLLGGTVDKEVL